MPVLCAIFNQAMHVLVRALGPFLAQSGVPNSLADPRLELHNGQGTVIDFNDDWRDTDAGVYYFGKLPSTRRQITDDFPSVIQ